MFDIFKYFLSLFANFPWSNYRHVAAFLGRAYVGIVWEAMDFSLDQKWSFLSSTRASKSLNKMGDFSVLHVLRSSVCTDRQLVCQVRPVFPS